MQGRPVCAALTTRRKHLHWGSISFPFERMIARFSMSNRVTFYTRLAAVAGLLAVRALPAQEPARQMRDTAGMHAMMTMMAECPMMSSMMQGPSAALGLRRELALTADQVTRLDALQSALRQSSARTTDSMTALHKEFAAITVAPQLDENGARRLYDRMGSLHTEMGVALLRARFDTRAVLTGQQRTTLENRSKGMMGMHGDMRMGEMNMGGMRMGNMSSCPMMMMPTDSAAGRRNMQRDAPGATKRPSTSSKAPATKAPTRTKTPSTKAPSSADHHGHKPPA